MREEYFSRHRRARSGDDERSWKLLDFIDYLLSRILTRSERQQRRSL